MMILDLGMCSNQFFGDPGVFWHLILKVGTLKVFYIFNFDSE